MKIYFTASEIRNVLKGDFFISHIWSPDEIADKYNSYFSILLSDEYLDTNKLELEFQLLWLFFDMQAFKYKTELEELLSNRSMFANKRHQEIQKKIITKKPENISSKHIINMDRAQLDYELLKSMKIIT